MQWEAGSQDQAEGSSQGDSTAMEQLSSEDCQALLQVRNLQGFWHIRCLHSDCDTAAEPGGDGGLGPLRRFHPAACMVLACSASAQHKAAVPRGQKSCLAWWCAPVESRALTLRMPACSWLASSCPTAQQGLFLASDVLTPTFSLLVKSAEITHGVMQVLSNLAALMARFGLHSRRETVKSLIETLAGVTRAPSCAGKLATALGSAGPLPEACACSRRRLQDVASNQLCLHEKC